ncbi:hypothetical protein ACFL2V_13445 [Pseudomonadota bacterium]
MKLRGVLMVLLLSFPSIASGNVTLSGVIINLVEDTSGGTGGGGNGGGKREEITVLYVFHLIYIKVKDEFMRFNDRRSTSPSVLPWP